MAYKTGIVATASGLLTELVSFAVSQAGWTLEHDVSASEKILKSTGSDGVSHILARLRTGVKDYNGNPSYTAWQNQEYTGAHYEHINVSMLQAYDPAGPTLYNEIDGRVGPWLFFFRSSSSYHEGSEYSVYIYPDLKEDSYSSTKWHNTGITWYTPYIHGSIDWGGDRRWYGYRYGDDFYQVDFLNNAKKIIAANQDTVRKSIFAYDANGNPCIFLLNSEDSDLPVWSKRRVGENANHIRVALQNPPAGSVAYTYASMCYDGKDYIYVQRAYNSVVWYRYQISTDTWTTIAPQPATDYYGYTGNHTSYIPKESDLAIAMGWTTDRILHKGNGTTLYMYDVGTDTWSSLASGGGIYYSYSAVWNGRDKFWQAYGNNETTFYRYNIRDNNWTTVNNLPSGHGYGSRLISMNQYMARITVDVNGTNYWMFGDADHIVVITKWANGEHRIQYFGNIDSYYSTQKVKLTSGVSAGTNVNLPVTGNFDQFQLYQKYYIVDIDGTSGAAEQFTLVASGVNSLTAGSLSYDYGPGAIIGVDPQPAITICDHFDSAFCLHSAIGQGGTGAVNNPHEQSYMMALQPTAPELVHSSAPGARGHVQMWPILLTNYASGTDGTQIHSINRFMSATGETSDYDYEKPEVRGQLIGVYCVSGTGTGGQAGPAPGDEIIVGGNTYIVFKLHNMFDSEARPNMLVAVGPKS